ncbi:GNAT family N-acetyltransferase [Paucibacter sp. B2R-40]|uniref:GNAT family N-acetyltransferase n=1 Tax=Paucibacter sp. B2R-40 TaxID=2893554 RepID=UPI0021E4EFE6|nr:GNAT family N-acetyltransferase [Paucibacter sp. B2R-40]MCV2353055.1 GNAT family N-acetyltransferase [Paucibacter sp. B2R-40]
MDFSVAIASPDERPVVRHLLQLYLHDFSAFDGDDVNEAGLYHYPWVEEYWQAPKAAFVFKVAGRYAGFCLVDGAQAGLLLPGSEHAICEFFVLRKYRKSGLGRFAAAAVFSSRAGRWEVAEHANNHAAQTFWRRVIADFSRGQFSEQQLNSDDWHGPVQSFVQAPTA